ncbi:phenazine biosynthesis FMN-dependent oxidase PhzG [Saccharopolyspora phatthalungensis]|uniref:Pyridoxamine 5'-phosphate oxidase n=1 Tax=Saccharopolyspora phatthalungensis TaxID=664693 RepID=A0A840QJV5_9PSEU|nr:phenazine biosynthesis FMN-dependent oxidase PhzG [Saccharopolyspora phatthalungensis]MBB5159499.1 pyridoxamine 5'-phosphate oxidase [Saccharopolyspora phatthalungensis]
MDSTTSGSVRKAELPSRQAATLTGDESLHLPEFDAPPRNPVELLHRWLDIATEKGVREPRAVVLATANELGRPSSRVVLLKEITDDGELVFTTHVNSRKGRDLAATPWASVNFYWRETLQQINVSGPVEPLPAARSDELFAERPVAAQATTAVSAQSTTLSDEQEMADRAQRLIDAGDPLPRPTGWGGYLLRPDAIEFWHGRANRLHRRLEYTRDGAAWAHRRLQP